MYAGMTTTHDLANTAINGGYQAIMLQWASDNSA